MSALGAYLLAAMIAWAPLERPRLGGEEPEHARARYAQIAEDIAVVALDAQEVPLSFVGRDRAKTATLLASLAFWESGFLELVDEGHCSPHTCDNGLAWTIWQIHTNHDRIDGITLDGLSWRYADQRDDAWLLAHADSVIRGPALVLDRQLAARFALHMARRGIGVWSTARTAMRHAAWWSAAHPFAG